MPRSSRAVRGLICLILAATAALILFSIHAFGQTRFLTIDEFQWGHATWLVSQGEVPYRDFYEHHLPLGYVTHALFLDDSNGFRANTLQLREIAFGYLLVALGALAWASWRTNRSLPEALLTVCVVPSVGFGLMSAIEYRGDNWAAFTLLVCLSLIEIGHRSRARISSAVAGGLFVVAILMTQKILLLGGTGIALLLLLSLMARSESARQRIGTFRIEHPWIFLAAGLATGLVALATALAFGILDKAFEINVLHALRHEQLYPGFGVAQFFEPFLTETALSSFSLIAFAALYAAGGTRSFWTLPLVAAGVGGLAIKAPFPYNYVLASWLIAICAVRGYCALVRRLTARCESTATKSGTAALIPLLYLLPLAVLPAQIGFVSGTSTNAEQLRLLEKIERYSAPDEVVLDDAGGALFRPDRGYHWYHGRAHVRMFRDYFEHRLVPDMRSSQALFWIKSVRFNLLPDTAKRYLLSHYIPFFGDLQVLGFTTRATGVDERRVGRLDVVRSGEYYVSPARDGSLEDSRKIRIDGVALTTPAIHLNRGIHEVVIEPDSSGFRFSYLRPDAFEPDTQTRPHTPLFEYRRSRRPVGSDAR